MYNFKVDMLSKSGKIALLKVLLVGIEVWISLVLIVFLFTGSFKSAYPIAILTTIAIITLFLPMYRDYKKDYENKQRKKEMNDREKE